jgi:hypothetical protein
MHKWLPTNIMADPFYAVSPGLLTAAQRDELTEGIVSSKFFGASALGKEFIDTSGFSLVFKRQALGTVCGQFPYMRQLLQSVLFDSCNAFYVNPLVMFGGSRVDAHIDCRLMTDSHTRIIPNLVSVYYAEASPRMTGGRLILNPGAENEMVIAPNTGDIVHFLGSTVHGVEEVKTRDRRVSVVCEQYNLSDSILDIFPSCDVVTGATVFARLSALSPEGLGMNWTRPHVEIADPSSE